MLKADEVAASRVVAEGAGMQGEFGDYSRGEAASCAGEVEEAHRDVGSA